MRILNSHKTRLDRKGKLNRPRNYFYASRNSIFHSAIAQRWMKFSVAVNMWMGNERGERRKHEGIEFIAALFFSLILPNYEWQTGGKKYFQPFMNETFISAWSLLNFRLSCVLHEDTHAAYTRKFSCYSIRFIGISFRRHRLSSWQALYLR